MPNWCSTSIYIKHNDTKKLEELYNNINQWMRKDAMENGFTNWLGNIVLNAKIGTVDTDKKTDLKCRGGIVFLDFDDFNDAIIIDTETAWVPMLKIWQKLIDKYLPDADIIFEATEPGCGIFVTNDADLQGKWLVDCWGFYEDWIEEGFYESIPKDVLINCLKKGLKTDCDDIDTLIPMFNKSEASEHASINEWDYISLNEAIMYYE